MENEMGQNHGNRRIRIEASTSTYYHDGYRAETSNLSWRRHDRDCSAVFEASSLLKKSITIRGYGSIVAVLLCSKQSVFGPQD
jgi:hypothetical protein